MRAGTICNGCHRPNLNQAEGDPYEKQIAERPPQRIGKPIVFSWRSAAHIAPHEFKTREREQVDGEVYDVNGRKLPLHGRLEDEVDQSKDPRIQRTPNRADGVCPI